MTQNKKSIFYFSPQERIDLLISWVSLSIAFALMISPTFLQISNILVSLPIAFLAVGTGFVFHELAHREAAKHYGFHSEFRAWYPGLAIAIGLVLISGGNFFFAAPGATYYLATNPTKKQDGVISIAGPVVNIIVGTTLVIIGAIVQDSFLQFMFIQAGMINFFFALFNMIPIWPFDGSKVIAWRGEYWLIVTAVAAILVFFPGIVFGLIGL
ncbi:MAG TPA: site-2 protease family protein [archaeon]|nr:site-2 protease family protein [archaeon]